MNVKNNGFLIFHTLYRKYFNFIKIIIIINVQILEKYNKVLWGTSK